MSTTEWELNDLSGIALKSILHGQRVATLSAAFEMARTITNRTSSKIFMALN